MINFSVGGPQLKITSCPDNVTKKEVTISGTMYDKNYGVELYINGEKVDYYSHGEYERSWSKSYILSEGKNTFEIILKNSAGKETKETKVITFEAAAPSISFNSWSELSETSQYRVSGSIGGEAEDATLYINDQEVSLNYGNSFSKTLDLNQGDNTFVFRVVNQYGKSQSVVKTIKYAVVNAPALEVNTLEETTSAAELTLSGTLKDDLDSNVELRINDKVVFNGAGNWTATIALKEGQNDIILTAINRYGKSTTVVKSIMKN